MDEAEITRYIANTFAGVDVVVASSENGAPEIAWGDSFFIYDPDRNLDETRRFPFATIVIQDYGDFDNASNLDRPGVFRLNIGVSKATYAKLFPGDAGDYDFAALDQGFVDLGSVPQYLPNWAQNNILIDTRWAPRHRAEILAFLRVHTRATRYFYDPANRDEVIAILAKYTKTTPDIAASTYDLYVRLQVIAPDGALFPEGLKANLDAFVAMGELAEPPPLAGFIDASFLGEAARP